MIVVQPGPLGEPAQRLLSGLAARGHELFARPESLGADARARTEDARVALAISDGPFVLDVAGALRALGSRDPRLLVLSRLGSHPDAGAAALRRLWRLEEHARSLGLPVLTLRLAPLVGPETPLWRKLRSRPALPKGGRKLVNPVAESDALETILRALDGRAAWAGWYEVAGSETPSLAELRELAARTPGQTGGAWEPPLEEIAEHRLAECGPWAEHFGLTPTPLAAWAARAEPAPRSGSAA